MSLIKKPSDVLLLGSFLYRSDLIFQEKLIDCWQEKFGPSIFFKSSFCPMKRYYAPEMGEEKLLQRFVLLTQNKFDRSILKSAKFWAIEQEEKNSWSPESRKLNLDVGTVALENFQLATGKNFTHRVYLGEGIFSDLTLIFQGESFVTLPWTYPDYGSSDFIEFLNWGRKYLHLSLKGTNSDRA